MQVRSLWHTLERINPFTRRVDGDGVSFFTHDDSPLRAELLSVEQLERHAIYTAHDQDLAPGYAPDQLIGRLKDNEQILLDTYERVTRAVRLNRRIAPAAEWLLDNFYLIEEQIRITRKHLPASYSRELPRLANGPAAGFPRVYGIALELISHVDGRLDAVGLDAFVSAYQSVNPLKIGELWAIPIMLRLALIENLRRVCVRLAKGRHDRDLAGDWAEQMLKVVEQNPGNLILVLADMARSDPPISGAFLAELTRLLQGQTPHIALVTTWIEHRVVEQGTTVERLVQAEGQAQAADQVSIGNSINSLRLLGSTDWRTFVEKHSVTEQILRNDPARVYAEMDFTTRDQYRHAIEAMAKYSPLTEVQIAQRVVEHAAQAPKGRARHVGLHLIDRGREHFESLVQVRPTLRQTIARWSRRNALWLYISAVAGVTLVATILLLGWLWTRDAHVLSILLAPLVLVSASQLGVALTNWICTRLAQPQVLPRMDFKLGIPREHRTLVAVPTMLSSSEAVQELLDDLEVRYLANRDPYLHFALLTDFVDAAQESLPTDAALLQQARDGIATLNTKYEADRSDVFFLLHRSRQWNDCQQCWMGYERKRGKLNDLNELLRGGRNRFSVIEGDQEILRHVAYVITLDSDTQLPRESARQMVGAMAHPLNRPVVDAKQCRVVEGYGILQPRVSISLPSAGRSWFARLFAGEAGVDPYTRAVSDVYQDVFSEGSFIGKGIYDIEAFRKVCCDLPENTVLSHDLLESAYARSGLLSDVELFEEFPSRYSTDVSRRHRWIRGDWQILSWLGPTVLGPDGQRKKNPATALSRWKMFDNLRRSCVAPAMLLLLLLSWTVLGTSGALATVCFILAVLALVSIPQAVTNLLHRPIDLSLPLHARTVSRRLGKQWLEVLFALIFLPYDAWVSADAIIRTLVRLMRTRKNLLEWRTAGDAERSGRVGIVGYFRSMWIAPTSAAVGVVAPLTLHHALRWPMVLLICAWAGSPLVGWWISRALHGRPSKLTDEQELFLRKIARKTWRFFEEFVANEEHFLPPDNFQEVPSPVVALRTSPTNIGLSLLSHLGAVDFGYLSAGLCLDRIAKTLATMARLERYRGHFFNWYDIRTLKPLLPRYVSTVDSGNLIGDLLVLRSGLMQMLDAPLNSLVALSGLRDTTAVLLEQVESSAARSTGHRMIERLQRDLSGTPRSLKTLVELLDRLHNVAVQLPASIGNDAESKWWAAALERMLADHRQEITQLMAWLALPTPPRDQALLSQPAWGSIWEQLSRLEQSPTLRQITELPSALDPLLAQFNPQDLTEASRQWLEQFRRAISQSSRFAINRMEHLLHLAEQCREHADMDLTFLFDAKANLFSIGFNVTNQRMDGSYYDLLASEARLCSYLAIAQGDVGLDHWFALGRMLTVAGTSNALLSWSGSMFEYLMPMLLMPTHENTILGETCRGVIRRQIEYGRQRGVPWGISESGYNAIDQQQNYQYRAFGVPGLGLKRGLADDLVIAPYATLLALMVLPQQAVENLQFMHEQSMTGPYGFYEAVDYTPSRVPRGEDRVIIRQYMAHHQGMGFLSIAHLLLDRPMQKRFELDPTLRAAELLLQERIPVVSSLTFPHTAEVNVEHDRNEQQASLRIITDPNSPMPEVHLLSNGRYHVVISSAGGGFSRWGDIAVNRWREDATRDCYGMFFYLRDLDSGDFWSNSYQPTLRMSRSYECVFTQGRAEFRRRDHGIETYTEVGVSPEDDVELRRITLTNRSERPRRIEVTSYNEVVMARAAQDLSHPAFSNLFVKTEFVRHRQAILCTRRPRSAGERPAWMVHLVSVRGRTEGEATFETDRMKFIGRTRTLETPAAMLGPAQLSNSEGSVLDPIASVRHVVQLEPGETVQIDAITGVGESRQAVSAMMDKYHDPRLTGRIFELAWTHSQVMLRQLNLTEADAQVFARLAGSIVYSSPMHRARAVVLARNTRGQSGLWAYGISGDWPIVVVRIRDQEKLPLVQQALAAHAYWRLKGLVVDLVIWNEDESVYRQTMQDRIMDLVAASPEGSLIDKPGGIFVRRGEQLSEEDRTLLQTVSRVILQDDAGTLNEQVLNKIRAASVGGAFGPKRAKSLPATAAEIPQRELAFFNGQGGFSPDGREYIVVLLPDQTTPAPWINVMANPQFGTIVSEIGSGYSWFENSHEFRLTKWYNDPVCDTSGEAFYMRDEENGRFWSPTPSPARGNNVYVTRHGFGYSVFEYEEDGIGSELSLYVSVDEPVKFARLRISNRSGRNRQMSVYGYWEWILGELRSRTLMHIQTKLDPISGALFTRNPYNSDFPGKLAFVDCSESQRTITADRTEFLGRNGTFANPAAMRRTRLSGRLTAGLDPCTAMQASFSLAPGQEKEIVFILGAANDEEHARQLIRRFHGVAAAQVELDKVWNYWSRTLGTVYVETPDASINYLANGWLLYQTLACRMWARTGFYQSGGAFGFRDQLQDAMALIHAEPKLLREHLIRAAGHQFREGDVQHWWHPLAGRGVRTHFSDDFLWLPLAVCRYVGSLGDTGVLDERIPFLSGRAVRADEDAYYDLPHVSEDIASLYDHCVRAIDNALRFGQHGLPLMGCGDWNDGMNMVGEKGTGESVWLGFFLYYILRDFIPLAQKRGDRATVDKYSAEAERLQRNIEAHAWDGAWYRRAYFDDGTPLGSASNEECQIDSISQSWSVLSGAAPIDRATRAMENVEARLVHSKQRLIQLLSPPFDKSNLDPGYIKGYVPGVRENGGQYTHAAIWTAMALGKMGRYDRAWELLQMINPITHSSSAKAMNKYRVEPYVVAADVYAVEPHVGRGGWTWYTGSAGWMYRLITETLLGIELDVDALRLTPHLAPGWQQMKIHYRYHETFYHISIERIGPGDAVVRLVVDSVELVGNRIPLNNDRQEHHVRLHVG